MQMNNFISWGIFRKVSKYQIQSHIGFILKSKMIKCCGMKLDFDKLDGWHWSFTSWHGKHIAGPIELLKWWQRLIMKCSIDDVEKIWKILQMEHDKRRPFASIPIYYCQIHTTILSDTTYENRIICSACVISSLQKERTHITHHSQVQDSKRDSNWLLRNSNRELRDAFTNHPLILFSLYSNQVVYIRWMQFII